MVVVWSHQLWAFLEALGVQEVATLILKKHATANNSRLSWQGRKI